ncbi:MAG: flap endonuclease-1 [Candidatus Lokiarchaeota archaeon]|nr:flap endonuclease-1 [Candidatus Lokiarchaeota archaeon]
MGVNISDLVKEVAKDITIHNLLGKKIAIDAFNSIYQFLATIRQRDGTPLKDYNGNVTSHLKGLFYRTLSLIEHDIKPLYVFDGPPHQLKLKTIQQRREIRQEQTKKMQEAQDAQEDAEAKKYAQATSKLNSEMIDEAKQLIEYMGIPWIEAAHDGEAEAARLIDEGKVWAAASQDYDCMLFGAKRLIRNLNINRKRKVKNTTVEISIKYYSLDKILERLGISQKQLIDLGILVGIDFFPGIKGVGEKTGLKLIKKHGSIEEIMKNKIKSMGKTIEINPILLKEIRDIFLHITPPKQQHPIKWTTPNENGIRDLLIEKHNFSESLLNSGIERLVKKKSSKMQTSLDKFF